MRSSAFSTLFPQAPFEGYSASVMSVAFSPDGLRVVSGSLDKTIRVWDVKSGALVANPFRGHSSSMTSAAYSPDGSCVVSGSHNGMIRVWNVEPAQQHLLEASTSEALHCKNAGIYEVLVDRGNAKCWIMTADGWLTGRSGELLSDFVGCKIGPGWHEGIPKNL